MLQKRAREVVDYRLSKAIEEKQNEDSIHISSKLEEYNKVNQIVLFYWYLCIYIFAFDDVCICQDYQNHLKEKRKGAIYRRTKFSTLYQEKQLQNRKNKEVDEIQLNIVVKGIYNNKLIRCVKMYFKIF